VAESDSRVRIQIAFEGGASIGALVVPAAADALQEALAGSDSVFELETDDGIYVLALAKVAYVKRAARETQIGFGATA
jgi:hypothetical protein